LHFQNEENLPTYNVARNRPGQAVADRFHRRVGVFRAPGRWAAVDLGQETEKCAALAK
jgi:hypothetical protein